MQKKNKKNLSFQFHYVVVNFPLLFFCPCVSLKTIFLVLPWILPEASRSFSQFHYHCVCLTWITKKRSSAILLYCLLHSDATGDTFKELILTFYSIIHITPVSPSIRLNPSPSIILPILLIVQRAQSGRGKFISNINGHLDLKATVSIVTIATRQYWKKTRLAQWL